MRTEEEIKKEVQRLELDLNRLNTAIAKVGYANIDESTKRYQDEKGAQLRTLYWVLGH